MPGYGPRDAASVLMDKGRRVALRYVAAEDRAGWRWRIMLDGQAVSMRELEDQAEKYERLRYRHTDRGPGVSRGRALRSASVVTDLHRLSVPVKVGNQRVSVRRGRRFSDPYGSGGTGGGAPRYWGIQGG
jgi:hypothetical protein